jgi:hypothetical protein
MYTIWQQLSPAPTNPVYSTSSAAGTLSPSTSSTAAVAEIANTPKTSSSSTLALNNSMSTNVDSDLLSKLTNPPRRRDENTTTSINVSRSQHHDTLYCEVCTGIPFDRYYIMFPPSEHPLFRRCIALSRPIIAATTLLPAHAVESLLCSVLYSAGSATHDLRCGHRVWCQTKIFCGVNCREGDGAVKLDHVVYCGECVGRADWVYARYRGLD